MSSTVYAPPLRIDRRPSRFLLLTLTAVHGLAFLCLAPLPVAWWIKLPAALAITAQWIVGSRSQAALSSAAAINCLVWIGGHSWKLYNPDGIEWNARLLPGAYIHPRLIILRFLTEDRKRRAVVLPRDSVAPDSHRRLRVQLGLLQAEATGGDTG